MGWNVVALLAALLSVAAAQSGVEFAACDPLVAENCLLPFPNNFWTVPDSTSDTGLRLRFRNDSFPLDRAGDAVNPAQWNELDGFQATPPLMSYFPDLSLYGVPNHENIAVSLDANCPTVIIDAETLEHLPHFGELDYSTEDTDIRAFMMWPTERLVGGRRYIVAMRNLLSQSTELPIAPSPAFQSLRDNLTSTYPSINARRNYFNEDIFPVLEAAGIDRDNLQLAWDFTVGSDQSITGRMISMRDDAISRIESEGLLYTITEVVENPREATAREIHGELVVPYYTNVRGPALGLHTVVDSEGTPVFQGWTNTSFTVTIPRSLVTGSPGQAVQYGHGLFGSQSEVNSGYLQEQADEYRFVLAATNWWGMDQYDVVPVVEMMTFNISDFQIIPDRCQQGFLNFVVLSKLLMSDGFINDPVMVYNGQPVIDANLGVAYDGNSQGGIYGASFMAIAPDVKRGVLGVPGAPYSLMLPRSVDFTPFFEILKFRYQGSIDRINLINIFQLLWDRSDPSGYMGHITSDPLPNTPVKQIIINYALGDSQVSWLSAYCLGRSINAMVFPGSVEEQGETMFGFPVTDVAVTTAVLQGYYYGAPAAPNTNTPPSADTDTHSCPRKDARQQAQMANFYATGYIENYCDADGCLTPTDPPIDDADCQQDLSSASVASMVADALSQLAEEGRVAFADAADIIRRIHA